MSAHSDAALGWRCPAGGGVEIHAVPGDHLSMIEELHCRVLAERLKAVLRKTRDADQTQGPPADGDSESRQ